MVTTPPCGAMGNRYGWKLSVAERGLKKDIDASTPTKISRAADFEI
jgi:hypothetical protein